LSLHYTKVTPAQREKQRAVFYEEPKNPSAYHQVITQVVRAFDEKDFDKMQSASPIDSPTILGDIKRVVNRIFRNDANDR
jgi:hypothetical protein